MNNPQAAFTYHLEGGDPHQFSIPPAPSIASQQAATETSELYWQALCRDLPFSSYETSPLIRAAAKHLNVTPATIFRGPAKSDLAGPYVSQFLLKPTSQARNTSTLTISAAATIDDQAVSQSAAVTLQVTGITTAFLGRTGVDDDQETPIAGVTVKFLGKDAQGNSTGCTGQSTTSDTRGNFSFTSLPTACTGPQLISYDGSTATSPAGKYAGVNLSYTLAAGQVTTSPVLIHLPRIDNAETVQVQQNAPNNQVFYFQTIPGLKVTIYAGTTFSLDDGSQPNPFPLVAIEIPLDRLPDAHPNQRNAEPLYRRFPAGQCRCQPACLSQLPQCIEHPSRHSRDLRNP